MTACATQPQARLASHNAFLASGLPRTCKQSELEAVCLEIAVYPWNSGHGMQRHHAVDAGSAHSPAELTTGCRGKLLTLAVLLISHKPQPERVSGCCSGGLGVAENTPRQQSRGAARGAPASAPALADGHAIHSAQPGPGVSPAGCGQGCLLDRQQGGPAHLDSSQGCLITVHAGCTAAMPASAFCLVRTIRTCSQEIRPHSPGSSTSKQVVQPFGLSPAGQAS